MAKSSNVAAKVRMVAARAVVCAALAPIPATFAGIVEIEEADVASTAGATNRMPVVVLRNDRVRVSLLPDAGGRVWRVRDESTNGVVSTFTCAHEPAAVDWTVRTNADRSVSFFAAGNDFAEGVSWQVETLLKNGDDFAETRSWWFNGSVHAGPARRRLPDGSGDSGVLPLMPGSTDEAEMRLAPGATNDVPYGAFPVATESSVDGATAYGHWFAGVRHLAARRDAAGEAELMAALAVERAFPPAYDALADFALRRGRWREARDWAGWSRAVDATDAAANFADGVASFRLGDFARAERRLALATARPNYASAAFAALAKCAFKRGDARAALDAAVRSWQANPHNPESFFLRVAAHRRLNEPERALKLSDMALRLWPIDHALRHERMELGALKRDEFDSLVRATPRETLFALAARYCEIGFSNEAFRLAEAAGSARRTDDGKERTK